MTVERQKPNQTLHELLTIIVLINYFNAMQVNEKSEPEHECIESRPVGPVPKSMTEQRTADLSKGETNESRPSTSNEGISGNVSSTVASTSKSTPKSCKSVAGSCGTSLYHGRKLDLQWLLKSYTFLEKMVQVKNNRNRNFVCCTICKEFKDEASRVARNGVVPLASGVRADGVEKLQRIIDHIDSDVHTAAVNAKKAAELWAQQSDKHPWVKTLKKHRAMVVNDLIALCIDVYNDSLLETPTARTWPSRSLAVLRTKSIQSQLNDSNDWEIQLDEFHPPGSALHYRDDVVYAEMLHIIGDLERKKLGEEFKLALCISLQIDGSVDRGNKDMKYVVSKYVTKDEPTVIKNRFIGDNQPASKGAKGLLDATVKTCQDSFVPTELLVGVTTDGEAANTGCDGGLWKLLENYLGHKLLTVWCYCHRSDLAMESALDLVPELKMWMSNLTGISKYFRTSPSKLKRMQQIFPDHCSFPAHFEVRFAEHIHNLIIVILLNLPGCIRFWQELISDPDPSMRRERSMATGMLKTWDESSLQLKQTCLMADITSIIQTLQKNLQKSNLILPDVITLKNNAVRKLKLIVDNPYPGGHEEQLLQKCNEEQEDEMDDEPKSLVRKRRKIGNLYVTTGIREWSAVRREIVMAFINFLDERLNIENNSIIKKFSLFLNAKTSKEMIANGRILIETIFGDDKVSEFATNVCDCWPLIQEVEELDISDDGVKMSHRLRRLIPVTTGILQKLLCSLMILSPHSMTVEKVISHYNQMKSIHRASTSDETINSRMFVALNGVGTAHYDPRPAVADFLMKKERRYREPELSIFSNRDFIKKFFRKEANL